MQTCSVITAWRWRRYCWETETTLTGLLCDLVWYFADGLKAPRWIRTTDGVQPCQ